MFDLENEGHSQCSRFECFTLKMKGLSQCSRFECLTVKMNAFPNVVDLNVWPWKWRSRIGMNTFPCGNHMQHLLLLTYIRMYVHPPPPYQSVYTKFYSTETTLLSLHDHPSNAISMQQVSCFCLLDLSRRQITLIEVMHRPTKWRHSVLWCLWSDSAGTTGHTCSNDRDRCSFPTVIAVV